VDIEEFTTYTQAPPFMLIPMCASFCMLVSLARVFDIYI